MVIVIFHSKRKGTNTYSHNIYGTKINKQTKSQLSQKDWPEMHRAYCPHSKLSGCNPRSYRTCSQTQPLWAALQHSLWLALLWGHTFQSYQVAHGRQKDPKGSNRMWIHLPLTSLPVRERYFQFFQFENTIGLNSVEKYK